MRLLAALWLGWLVVALPARAEDVRDADGTDGEVMGPAERTPDPAPTGESERELEPGDGESELGPTTELPPLPEAKVEVDLDTLEVEEPVAPATRTPERDIRRLLRPEASILQARNRLDRDLMEKGRRLVAERTLEQRLWRDLAVRATAYLERSAALELERRRVRVRLAALSRSARTPMLSDLSLAGSVGAYESLRNARAVLETADRRRVEAYRGRLEAWEEARTDLLRRARNLERTRKAIGYLERELEWDRAERAALEAAVVREPEFYAAYAQEIEQLDPVIAARIAELAQHLPADRRRMYFEETRGGLAAPIRNSEIVGRFGTRFYKGITSKWRGAHFVPLRPPREGKAEARAIYWGWVAWTGWMQGLGQVVIVDHTMGYWSIYGHLSAIEVEVGAKVSSGQTLGRIGDTESFFGDRLYLELRKDGVAIDPVPWLK